MKQYITGFPAQRTCNDYAIRSARAKLLVRFSHRYSHHLVRNYEVYSRARHSEGISPSSNCVTQAEAIAKYQSDGQIRSCCSHFLFYRSNSGFSTIPAQSTYVLSPVVMFCMVNVVSLRQYFEKKIVKSLCSSFPFKIASHVPQHVCPF